MGVEFDPFSKETHADPYPHYKRLRDAGPCVYLPKHDLYVVSRFEEVDAVLRNHATFSSTGGVGPDWHQEPMMPMYDPPQHTRLRRLVAAQFTPKAVAGYTKSILPNVTQLFAKLLEAGKGDIVSDVAVPLSLGTMAEILGVPQERRPDFYRWSEGIVTGLAGDRNADVERLRKQFVSFLKDLIAQRRKDPQSGADVISLLLATDQERLSEPELLAFCVVLLVAGFETTANGICHALLALLEHPTELARLRENPQLSPKAVEETIRYDGPVQSFFRNTLAATRIGDVEIPAGKKVMVLYASANRDERKYEEPDTFKLDRDLKDHLGFGAGIHYCLGAPLARLQMDAFTRQLLASTKEIRVAGEVVRSGSVLFRGVKSLPVVVQGR